MTILIDLLCERYSLQQARFTQSHLPLIQTRHPTADPAGFRRGKEEGGEGAEAEGCDTGLNIHNQ
jgi:hypothetical protein